MPRPPLRHRNKHLANRPDGARPGAQASKQGTRLAKFSQPIKPKATGRTLRVIVQTKPKSGDGLIRGGHKIFAVENVSEDTTVVQVKDTLERQKCGIKATGMNMMCGRTLMANQ
jgi:hypothetical protein